MIRLGKSTLQNLEFQYNSVRKRGSMHVFSQRVIDYLIQPHHSEVEQSKITFGVRMLFSDLYKFFAVYGTALLLGCLLEVLVMHLTFYFLRQVGLGYHFVSELQ